MKVSTHLQLQNKRIFSMFRPMPFSWTNVQLTFYLILQFTCRKLGTLTVHIIALWSLRLNFCGPKLLQVSFSALTVRKH